MLPIAEAAQLREPGWWVTAAFIAAVISQWIGLGAWRLGRVGEWYYAASGAALLLMIVSAGLHSVVLKVAGLAMMFALGVYGTVMRFRPPKEQQNAGKQPRS
jgi:hypothetical protein